MVDSSRDAGSVGGRPAPRRRAPARRPTDEEMLDAASAVFGEAGFHEATSAELCASFIVGMTVEGARYALLSESLEPGAAAEFATQFVVAALRHVDPGLVDTLADRGGSPQAG